jgi:hypothetical protein
MIGEGDCGAIGGMKMYVCMYVLHWITYTHTHTHTIIIIIIIITPSSSSSSYRLASGQQYNSR